MSREEKKQQILNAALKVFAKFGFKKTTVEDIAGELNMTKGNLYLYAKNKRDLYEQAVSWGLIEWQASSYKAALKKTGALERIVAYCSAGYDYLCRNDDLRALISNDQTIFPISPSEDRFSKINERSLDLLREMLASGIEKGEIRQIDTSSVSGILYSIYVMLIIKTYIKKDEEITGKMLEAGFDIVLNGLKP